MRRGLERKKRKGSKRRNGDMHAGVVEVEVQAHPFLSKNFDYIDLSN